VKASGQASAVAMAIRSIRRFVEKSRRKFIPLVAVPLLAKSVKKCARKRRSAGWTCLATRILAGPGLRVNIEGKPNQFKRPGRPRSLFAPKSSRIARWLLIEPERAFSQRELAKSSGLDEGFTSRIVRQLEEQRLVARDKNGAVKVADFDALLDAWREDYDFSKHHIVRGHIAARSSDDVLRQLAVQLKQSKVEHAATGLAGAWLLNQFAGFRLVVFYVGQMPSAVALNEMGFHEEQRARTCGLSCRTTKVSFTARWNTRYSLCSPSPGVFGFEESSRAFGRSSGAVAPENFKKGKSCLKNQQPPPVIRPTKSCG